MFDNLMKLFSAFQDKLCETCPTAKQEHITNLSDEEKKEWAIIKTEEDTLRKDAEKLAQRREILDARNKIFLGKIRLRFDETSPIIIKDGRAFKMTCHDDCKNFQIPPFKNPPGI